LDDELRVEPPDLLQAAEQELRDERARLRIEHRDLDLPRAREAPGGFVRLVPDLLYRRPDDLPGRLPNRRRTVYDPRNGHRRNTRLPRHVLDRRCGSTAAGPALRQVAHLKGPFTWNREPVVALPLPETSPDPGQCFVNITFRRSAIDNLLSLVDI